MLCLIKLPSVLPLKRRIPQLTIEWVQNKKKTKIKINLESLSWPSLTYQLPSARSHCLRTLQSRRWLHNSAAGSCSCSWPDLDSSGFRKNIFFLLHVNISHVGTRNWCCTMETTEWVDWWSREVYLIQLFNTENSLNSRKNPKKARSEKHCKQKHCAMLTSKKYSPT